MRNLIYFATLISIVFLSCSTKPIQVEEQHAIKQRSTIAKFKATRTGNVADAKQRIEAEKKSAWESQLEKIRKRREFIEAREYAKAALPKTSNGYAREMFEKDQQATRQKSSNVKKYGDLIDTYTEDGYVSKTYIKETPTYKHFTTVTTYKGKTTISKYSVRKGD